MSSENSVHWSNIDPKARRMIMMGLALGMFVACLDGTIITTSMSTIAADLGGMELYAWVFTAYMLCETVMIPIAGKLSDHYGRKPLLLAGLAIFIVGSIMGGLSNSMEMLILFRALQGLGGGILMPVATAAVADLYAPHLRGRIQGSLASIFGIATAIGPLLGGIITDYLSWHWCFFINVPIAVITLILTSRRFPVAEVDTVHKIDYAGISLLTLLLVDVMMVFTWGGTEYDWFSVQIIGMVMIAVILLAAFVLVERRADDPVLNPRLFRNRTIVCSVVAMLIFGVGMMGAMTYVSLFMQNIIGYSATTAGLMMIAMVIGMMMTAMISGNMLTKTGARPWLIAGPIVTALGMVMMAALHAGSPMYMVIMALFVTGLGLGCIMSTIMTVVQNESRPDELGMTTSAANRFRPMGSTIATGLFTTFIAAHLGGLLSGILPDDLQTTFPMDTGIMDQLGNPLLAPYVSDIVTAYGDSICFAFMIGAAIVLCVIVLVLLMRKNPCKLPHDDFGSDRMG